MHEWDPVEKEKREYQNLDERLNAYYGPALKEQPLPSTSWLRLRSQLRQQRSARRSPGGRRLWHIRRNMGRSMVPIFIQHAFSRIVSEARLPFSPSILACSFKFRVHAPAVHVFPVGRRNIRLTLPLQSAQSMEAAELDVLLATGLARYLSMRKPEYAIKRLFLSSVIPLACIALAMLWRQNLPLFVLLIAIMLCLGLCVMTVWLLHMQGRSMALQADTLLVQWLGRERACRGLHALADHTRMPSHGRWGELSLAERIERVCGTGVRIEHESLMLVR